MCVLLHVRTCVRLLCWASGGVEPRRGHRGLGRLLRRAGEAVQDQQGCCASDGGGGGQPTACHGVQGKSLFRGVGVIRKGKDETG